MSITIREIHGSREGQDATDRSSTADLAWQVTGSDDTDAMRTALASVVPAIFDGLIFRRLSWEQLGPRIWEFNAHYVHPAREDRERELENVDDFTFRFDTTGGSLRITSGLTEAKFPESATSVNSAINAQTLADPEGVDIAIPALRFVIEYKRAKASIDVAYRKTLARMTAGVNNSMFYGFNAGEVLFLGASGRQGKNDDPVISYEFAASENAEGLVVGHITGIAKDGWDYLWVRWTRETAADDIPPKPKAVFVNQVYHRRNFADLGIGTG